MKIFLGILALLACLLTAVMSFAQGRTSVERWKPFKNIELWKYCLSLPLNGYVQHYKQSDVKAKRFYGWGYWSNSIYESRFLEIVWLRDSEVIKFHADFPLADVPLWRARLAQLLAQTTVCTPD